MQKPPLRAMFPLALLLCSACASETFHDVTLLSVRAVDAHDQTELPLPGDPRPYVALMMGNPAVLRLSPPPDLKTAERPHRPLLKVEFTSRSDLSKLDFADNLSTESFFCRRPDAKVLLGGVWNYSEGHLVPSGYEETIQSSSTVAGRLYTYYTFFSVARNGPLPSDRPAYEAFDLRRKTEDVCFRLVGGRYRAFGYYSNTVTIPKAVIARALS
jgi:hypothetical protein